MREVLRKCTSPVAAVLVVILTISTPVNIIAANPVNTGESEEGQDLEYAFTEEMAEDKSSSNIVLEISENNGAVISEIVLPDGTSLHSEAAGDIPGFKVIEGTEKNIVRYEANENGTFVFQVYYQVPVSIESEEIEQEVTGEMETREVRMEYVISGIEKKSGTDEAAISNSEETESGKDGQFNDVLKTETTGSIALSEGQVMESPGDFVIGQSETFKLTVRYTPALQNMDRRLKLTVPEGFELTKVPTMGDLESASEVLQDGNTLEIHFKDSLNVTAVFDIQVRQKKEVLYELASRSAAEYKFLLEGFADTDTPVLKKELVFEVEELPQAEYQVEGDTELCWEDIRLPNYSSSFTSADYAIKVIKKQQTKKDEKFHILIPKCLQSGSYSLINEISQIEVNGSIYRGAGLSDNFQITGEGDYWNLSAKTVEMENAFQNAYTQDTTCTITINCHEKNTEDSLLFIGKSYESVGNLSVCSEDQIIYEKSLILDTATYTGERQMSSYSSLKNSTEWAGSKRMVDIRISGSPFQCSIERVEGVIEIPKELQITNISEDTYVKEIKTNKGNRITASQIAALPEDEHVEVIKVGGMIRHHGYLSILLETRVREAYQDGSGIDSGTTAAIQLKATSPDMGVQPYQDSIPFLIVKKDQDNAWLKIESMASDRARIGMAEEIIGCILLEGNQVALDTQIYKQARIKVEGKEALCLTDYIQFLYDDSDLLRKLTVKYQTNFYPDWRKRSLADSGNYRRLDFHMEEGEYLTGLEILCDELDICRGASSCVLKINLMSERVPDTLPVNGDRLSGLEFSFSSEFYADNTETTRRAEGETATFVYPVDKEVLSIEDLSKTQLTSDRENCILGTVRLGKIDDADRITYESPVIDFEGTNPELLSLITGFQTYPYNYYFQWHVSTNKGRTIITGATSNLALEKGEYVTALKMVGSNTAPYTPMSDYSVNLIGTPVPYSKLTGQYIGDDFRDYPINAAFEADNKKRYQVQGKSTSISGKGQVVIQGIDSVKMAVSERNVYQGNFFTLSLEQNFKLLNPTGREFQIQRPAFYLEVDSRYAYENGSAQLDESNLQVTWEEGKLPNGNSVLCLEAEDYDIAFDSKYINLAMELKLRVKPETMPAEDIQPIVAVWTDFSTSADRQPGEGQARVVLENTVKGEIGLQDDPSKEFYKWKASLTGGQTILTVSELGVGTVGLQNSTYGMELEGHDNDVYGQQFSIISDFNKPTRDWVIYIPIPKAGKSVIYNQTENGTVQVKESPVSNTDMNLAGAVELKYAPEGTEIAYSIEKNPLFSLDGSTVGDYRESVESWDQVTMVRIKIPKLGAKEKLYPTLYFTSEKKQKPGTFTCYGGGYLNVKIGDTEEYFYGDAGYYMPVISYTIIDYQLSGHIWEEMSNQRDDICTESDRPKSGVSVKAVGRSGEQFYTVSDEKGDYTLVIPSAGEYVLEVQLPNSVDEKYLLVEADCGTAENSSKFDPDTYQLAVTLNQKNIKDLNAGLWAERRLQIEQDEIYVMEGGNTAVQTHVFPSYVDAAFQQCENTAVAEVDETGLVTGKQEGTTTASVSIPDGEGGRRVCSYKIHVVSRKQNITVKVNYGRADITEGEGEFEILEMDTGEKNLVLEKDTASQEQEVTVKYAADMHYYLKSIRIYDSGGYEYLILDKDSAEGTVMYEEEIENSLLKAHLNIEEESGIIRIKGIINTSLNISIEFSRDHTYQVGFYLEQGDAKSLYGINDGLFEGNYVGRAPEVNPQKEGYEFCGWSMDGTDNPDMVYYKERIITNSSISYYAIWKKK